MLHPIRFKEKTLYYSITSMGNTIVYSLLKERTRPKYYLFGKDVEDNVYEELGSIPGDIESDDLSVPVVKEVLDLFIKKLDKRAEFAKGMLDHV